MRDAIIDNLYSKKLIRDTQHGFTQGRSCLTNLLKFLEEVTAYVDEGSPVDVLYLDFSKAFDKVPHKRLVNKVKAHGIGNNIWRWIEAWLSDRSQRVVINGHASGWATVTSGVPQGSVLGPTLFVIYINDIDDGITSSLLKFADDTKLLRKVGTQDDCEALQKDIHTMHKWSEDWQMLFNIDKCKCLHIGYGNNHTTYQLGGTEVPTATQEKDLGIIVTENLNVSEQCAKVTKTANKVLGIIKRSYDDKSIANLLPLYKALVRPHIEYCVQAWRPYYQKDVDNLEKIQRRATRMMEEVRGMDYEEQLRQTSLVTLEARRTRADIIEVFKIMKGLEGLKREDFVEMEVEKTHKINKTVIKPTMTYGAECWTMKKKDEMMMNKTEMRMLRWIQGVSLREHKINEEIREAATVQPIATHLMQKRLRWYGHVRRRDESHITRTVLDMEVEGVRPRVRPKLRYMDTIKRDIKKNGLTDVNILDRKDWRLAVSRANH